MLAGLERSSDSTPSEPAVADASDDPHSRDEERAYTHSGSPFTLPLGGRQATTSEETELQTRTSSAVGASSNYIKRKTSQLLQAISPSSRPRDTPLPRQLVALVDSFSSSELATQLQTDINEAAAQADQTQALPDVALENDLTRGRQRASWGTQFRILSGRAFKNLYRDPALLAAHYISAIVVARTYRLLS